MTDKRIAVYPGSFDPIHNGHLDIIQRSRRVFDEVVVAVLENEAKKPLFSVEDRMSMIEAEIRDFEDCKVESFSGLLVDFMDEVGARTIIRGLRAVSDFEYEFQMTLMNRRLEPRIETVFMVPNEEFIYLSSRLAREVFFLGGDLRGLVPDTVLEKLAGIAQSRRSESEPES
jgi:pantetheine-phosphate adenylyltransferase